MKIYYSIELLRFFTSISVLLFHYKHFFFPFSTLSVLNYQNVEELLPYSFLLDLFYKYGFYGVQLFYCISGFVFSHIYLIKKEKKFFFINRFARLYPLHFVTLLLVALLQLINIEVLGSYQGLIHFNDFYHFILQIFFISAWGFQEGHSFNGPIWSVSIELGIYFIFFLLIESIKKYKKILLFFIICFFLVIRKITGSNNLFLECAQLFFLGTFVYSLISSSIPKLLLSVFALILLPASFLGNFKIFLFCPALLLLFLSIEEYLARLSLKNILKNLGSLTYSLYLLHFPLQILIILIFNILLIPSNIFISKYFFTGYFLILFVLSFFSYKFVEYPLNKFIRAKFS